MRGETVRPLPERDDRFVVKSTSSETRRVRISKNPGGLLPAKLKSLQPVREHTGIQSMSQNRGSEITGLNFLCKDLISNLKGRT